MKIKTEIDKYLTVGISHVISDLNLGLPNLVLLCGKLDRRKQ